MNRSETIAKIVVESLLPGSKMNFRPAQETRTHDFDLVLTSGFVAALEVTSATDPETLRTEAAIFDERRGGSFIPRTKAQQDWYINPTVQSKINQVRACADEYLSSVEKEGVTKFYGAGIADWGPAVDRIWRDLKVEAGRVIKWKTPGIGIALPGEGGWLSPHHVHDAVRLEAAKQDNVEKLTRSGASDRHLFLFIDPSHALPWMTFRELPSGAMPDVPTAITYLWACAPYDRTLAVLHGSVSSRHWERASVPYDPTTV